MLDENYLNISPDELGIFLFVVFIAALVRGYSGFGFSTIFMVGAMTVIPPSQLVPISIALEVLASATQAPRVLVDVNRRYLAILLAASLVGVPTGIYILTYVPEDNLKSAVYCLVLVSALLLLIWRPNPIEPTGIYLVSAGLLAGTVNGATALSGLVLALFFTATTVSSSAMRATMISYLFFTDVITGGLLIAASYYDSQTMWRFLVSIPLLLAGVWLGNRQFLATPSKSFKTIVMWLLLGFCTAGLLQFF